jgi:hypothetical protein
MSTISQLPDELLSATLALVGTPQTTSLVCKSWKDCEKTDHAGFEALWNAYSRTPELLEFVKQIQAEKHLTFSLKAKRLCAILSPPKLSVAHSLNTLAVSNLLIAARKKQEETTQFLMLSWTRCALEVNPGLLENHKVHRSMLILYHP